MILIRYSLKYNKTCKPIVLRTIRQEQGTKVCNDRLLGAYIGILNKAGSVVYGLMQLKLLNLPETNLHCNKQ
jgi:hypothetical protein